MLRPDRIGQWSSKGELRFEHSLEYKDFDLNISTYGVLNYHVSDDIYNSLNSCYGLVTRMLPWVTPTVLSDGTYISSVPHVPIIPTMQHWHGNDLFSSRKIQNAAYWKIANVELGYNFPDKWFGGYVSGVRLYVSAQNLYTFTGYHGYNVDYAGGTFTPRLQLLFFPKCQNVYVWSPLYILIMRIDKE